MRAVYTRIAGLRLGEAGWKSAVIEPCPHRLMLSAEIEYIAPTGKWKVKWNLDIEKEKLFINTVVPAGCTARINIFGKPFPKCRTANILLKSPFPQI